MIIKDIFIAKISGIRDSNHYRIIMVLTVLYLASFIILTNGLEVRINMDSPHATVEKEFLSVTLDGGWQTFNFSYPRMETLLRGLSPAYLRLGGASADHLVFSNQPVEVFKKSSAINSFNITEIDRKVELVRAVGFKLLLDLDLQLRYGTQWDPTNTVNLLGHLHKQKYHDVLNFELGNEPGLYGESKHEVKLNGTRIGEDFSILHKLLTDFNFTKCTTVGPDAAVIRPGTGLFYQYLQEAGKFLSAATFHHYYLNGRIANLSDFIDVKVFNKLLGKINEAKDIIRSTKTPSLPLWIGEAADAYGGGARNISDSYVSGFLWLDKLGVSAREGIGVVMRQTFYGGNYGLISGITPTTNYWLSHVHKQLTGEIVLNVTTASTKYDQNMYLKRLWNFFQTRMHKNNSQEVRVYAHCTKASSKYKSGSITIFALNLEKSGSETLTFLAPLSSQMVNIYLLTPTGPGGLQAKHIALNGKMLEMIDDHTLPELVPVQQSASQAIKLPALTFGFFVFPNANAAACL